MAEKQSITGNIITVVLATGMFYGMYRAGKWFKETGDEFGKKEQAEFIAFFNIPDGDSVEFQSDEWRLRNRIVNNRLHTLALQFDEEEKEAASAEKAILEGIGSDYQQDVQMVKLRRAAVDSFKAKLGERQHILSHAIELANHRNYNDITNEQNARDYKPDNVKQGEDIFPWLAFLATAFWGYVFTVLSFW